MVQNLSKGSETQLDYNYSSQYSGTNGVYQSKEDENVYFYRGAVNNNIIFGNFCWKIIRTTENKGIKLIYNGTPSSGQCNNSGTNTYIGNTKYAYNSSYNNAQYVGYTYGSSNTDSTIKTQVENWYKNNLTSYDSYIDDEPYCNDRSNADTSNMSTTLINNYGSAGRASYYAKTVNPTIKCPQASDKYTVSTDNGNGLSKYKVGLITLDEAAMAGATSRFMPNGNDKYNVNASYYQNSTYYLYNGDYYWTMSPVVFNGSYAGVGRVNGGSHLNNNRVDDPFGVRPVVTLSSSTNITTSGDGSVSSPYVVE